MALHKNTLAMLALPALVTLSLVSPVASAQISFSDNFNDRTLTQERIGNNWTWFDTAYEADCATSIGGFGPYSTGGGGFSNYVALNNNYARLDGGSGHDGSGYFRAGLEGADGAGSLNVYNNQFGTAACNEIKIFQEFAGGAPGDYTFTATVIGNQYTPIQGSVGVFMKVLNVDDGYSEAQFVKQLIIPPSYDAAPFTVTFNFTVNSDVSNRIVQVGMYAQHAAGETASAIWDDVSISQAVAGSETAEPADPNAIPTLPLWALFSFVGLISLIGFRKKR